MITLYGFGKCFNVMDASPFVVKVELFMRMANIPYQVKYGAKYLKKSPKGKLPFINDDGIVVADSEAIISYLTDKYLITLDAELTAEQKAQAHLMTKSLDEGLYWCILMILQNVCFRMPERFMIKAHLFINGCSLKKICHAAHDLLSRPRRASLKGLYSALLI